MGKPPGFLRNIPVRIIMFSLFVIALRSAYFVVFRGESCNADEFCFNVVSGVRHQRKSSSSSTTAVVVKSSGEMVKKINNLWATEGFRNAVVFYSSVFQNLISESVLSPNFKALCVDTATGVDVFALREIGVEDSVGVSPKGLKPMVIPAKGFRFPFDDTSFDFVFCGDGAVENSVKPGELASEIDRTLKPDGFLVVHTKSNDTYSFNSLLALFNFCRFINSKDFPGFHPQMPFIRQIILQKLQNPEAGKSWKKTTTTTNCSVPSYKHNLINQAEPLISEEPKKPWITLKKNIQKIRYLPSMVDISFKPRYIYIDVGSRSYGSSIVSWFKKQYPKQNKTFEIYAIEADPTFHEQYKFKKGVTLLPYAAWVRNETLSFEINDSPGGEKGNGRGMGRIQAGESNSSKVEQVEGFDFAEWLKRTVDERDYVVMKMDVEGSEFDLIRRLLESGGTCLIDELFLECHYSRWQKCCPGKRSSKYHKTYVQCLHLFTSLRNTGVLIHQWW